MVATTCYYNVRCTGNTLIHHAKEHPGRPQAAFAAAVALALLAELSASGDRLRAVLQQWRSSSQTEPWSPSSALSPCLTNLPAAASPTLLHTLPCQRCGTSCTSPCQRSLLHQAEDLKLGGFRNIFRHSHVLTVSSSADPLSRYLWPSKLGQNRAAKKRSSPTEYRRSVPASAVMEAQGR